MHSVGKMGFNATALTKNEKKADFGLYVLNANTSPYICINRRFTETTRCLAVKGHDIQWSLVKILQEIRVAIVVHQLS